MAKSFKDYAIQNRIAVTGAIAGAGPHAGIRELARVFNGIKVGGLVTASYTLLENADLATYIAGIEGRFSGTKARLQTELTAILNPANPNNYTGLDKVVAAVDGWVTKVTSWYNDLVHGTADSKREVLLTESSMTVGPVQCAAYYLWTSTGAPNKGSTALGEGEAARDSNTVLAHHAERLWWADSPFDALSSARLPAGRTVRKIEIHITTEPCPTCKSNVFDNLRSALPAALRAVPIYIYIYRSDRAVTTSQSFTQLGVTQATALKSLYRLSASNAIEWIGTWTV